MTLNDLERRNSPYFARTLQTDDRQTTDTFAKEILGSWHGLKLNQGCQEGL